VNDTGLPGVTLDDREHVCVFYRGPEERDTVLAAFLGAGLSEGDKCLCIADSTDAETEAARLDPHHRRTGPDQLTVLPATAYLTDGRFVPERVYSQWDSIIGGWVDDGYRHVRGTGELSWFLRQKTDDATPLLEYEALCNKLVKRRPATIFCLYDLDLLDAGLLPGVLRHHSAALARGVLFRAPRPLPQSDGPEADGSGGGHPWRIEERPGGANDALLLANLLLAGARHPAEIADLLDGIRRAVLDLDDPAKVSPGPEGQRFLRALAGLAAPHLRAAQLEAELATRPPAGATDVGAAELAGALLDGTPLDAAAAARVRSLGLDLEAPLRAIVVRPTSGSSGPSLPTSGEGASERCSEAGAGALRDELAAQGIRLVAARSGDVACLAGDGASLDTLLTGLGGPGRVIGVGRAHAGAAGAARSYSEARRAAGFAAGLDRPVLRHEDLGLFSLLADGGDPGAMAGLVAEWLGPLLAHDAASGGSRRRYRGDTPRPPGRRPPLLPTLAAYLDAGAAQQATADALGVHVSTLKYRLGRIEEVTGRDLSAPDVRFQLQVALAAHRTLTVLHPQGD
jgi:hypothetical protein